MNLTLQLIRLLFTEIKLHKNWNSVKVSGNSCYDVRNPNLKFLVQIMLSVGMVDVRREVQQF